MTGAGQGAARAHQLLGQRNKNISSYCHRSSAAVRCAKPVMVTKERPGGQDRDARYV